MRPYDVKSENDNLAMTSDNHPQDAERWSILNFADKVSLHPPANTDWVGWVEIPRDQFNAIVDWYIKDQAPPATDHVVGTKPIALISEGTLRLLLQDTGGTFRISAPKWPTETETIPLYLAVPPATDHVVGSGVDLRNVDAHPVASKFHDLAVELEKLPPGERQTEMAAVLNALRVDAQNLLNGYTFMKTSNVRMTLGIMDDVRDVAEGKYDNQELDGTDLAHPAWWRGNDAGVMGAVRVITKALEEGRCLETGSSELSELIKRVVSTQSELRTFKKDSPYIVGGNRGWEAAIDSVSAFVESSGLSGASALAEQIRALAEAPPPAEKLPMLDVEEIASMLYEAANPTMRWSYLYPSHNHLHAAVRQRFLDAAARFQGAIASSEE